jgi:hypothetical protein
MQVAVASGGKSAPREPLSSEDWRPVGRLQALQAIGFDDVECRARGAQPVQAMPLLRHVGECAGGSSRARRGGRRRSSPASAATAAFDFFGVLTIGFAISGLGHIRPVWPADRRVRY